MARTGKAFPDAQLVGDKTSAREVAQLRDSFNAAIQAQDLDAIRTVLSEDAVLVPGDDATLIAGREAQIEAWQSIYAQCQKVGYVRTPARIEISDEGHLAAETGRWKGGWLSEGMTINYTGRYFAKWRHDEDGWKLTAELFVTIKRGGGMG